MTGVIGNPKTFYITTSAFLIAVKKCYIRYALPEGIKLIAQNFKNND